MCKDQLIDLIQNYKTDFDEERLYQRQLLEFLEANDDFWERTNEKGHITASAWVLNPTCEKALLIHHAGLNKWFQPGGHIEPEDVSVEQAAARELVEECDVLTFSMHSKHIFDIDIHIIPKKKDVPTHLHYDIRYAFLVAETEVKAIANEEIKALQWVELENLRKDLMIQQSIRRMALKSRT